MSDLRTLRTRIRSVRAIRKITRAMSMIAASRVRRAQAALGAAEPYLESIEAVVTDLVADVEGSAHPLLEERPVVRRLVIVLGSDRGLCGGFNVALTRRVLDSIPTGTPWIIVGRKLTSLTVRLRVVTEETWDDLWDGFTAERARRRLDGVLERFLSGEVDRVDVAFNRFISVMRQVPHVFKLVPPDSNGGSGRDEAMRILDPDRSALTGLAVPRAIAARFLWACRHSLASEYGARMTAMDAAARNAGKMIDGLTLKMNRARQAAITKELIEIVSGAEALR